MKPRVLLGIIVLIRHLWMLCGAEECGVESAICETPAKPSGAVGVLANPSATRLPVIGPAVALHSLYHIVGEENTEKNESVLVSLLSFLLQQTYRRRVYIIYDDFFPGVSKTVKSCYKTWSDITILKYDSNPTQLEETFGSPYHGGETQTVVTLCSPNNTNNIFRVVRQHSLESPSIRWLVIVEDDIINSLQESLREGTQVGMAVRVSDTRYSIHSSYIHPDNTIRFEVIGLWDDLRTSSGSKGHIFQPMFPDLDILYLDFMGREMTVAAVSNWPWFKLKYLEDGTPLPDAGIDVNVITTLSHKLNFTMRVVEPEDRGWGGPKPDGRITGMVGMVARHEANFAINEFSVTRLRETVVDFTNPYYLESTTLTSRAPKEKNRGLAIFHPFSYQLWILLILVTIFMGPLGYLATWSHDHCLQKLRLLVLGDGTVCVNENKVAENVIDISSKDVLVGGMSYSNQSSSKSGRTWKAVMATYSFNMFRSVLNQGNFIYAKAWPIRLVLFSWYAFCIIMYALYSGTLTAYLTKPTFEKPIDSLEDLEEATQGRLVPAIQQGTSLEELLKTAEFGIFKRLWDTTDPSRSFPSGGKQAMDMVLTHDIVYISAKINSEIRAAQKGRNHFYHARQTFFPQSYGIVCTSGAPFKNRFDSELGKMVQAGLINKWMRDELEKLRKSMKNRDDQAESTVAGGALSLDHLQGAFFILASGCFLSAVIFFLETTKGCVSRPSTEPPR
ncbi:ionotropic receptor 40a-like [Homarus americanus]|uniref:ionotropic receptor 40a-like n=1 Tax=Homarus americanus TaxID=6706 RepID=UPI001C43BB3A|nr:ionotropic receptor 40a-like [Homarus americanus]